MAVNIGTTGISNQQRRYLQVSHGAGTSLIADLLAKIASDEGILSGEEELHPGWLEIFEKQRRFLPAVLPPELFDQ